MKYKKRNINSVIENNVGNKNLKLYENIKNLINLLHKYTSNDNLDDISDFLASSYKNFLIDSIYEEINYCPKHELNHLICICLDIIKNNHKEFKYQNIYFICLNTLFILLNKSSDNTNFIEFLVFKIFLDLVNQNEWTEYNHIKIFAKLNYINLFIISNTFEKYISNDDYLSICSFKKIINNTYVQRYIDGEEIFIKNSNIYNKNELNKNIKDDNEKIEKYFNFNFLIKKHRLSNLFSETNHKNINSISNYKYNEKRTYKKIKIFNYKDSTENKVFYINKKFTPTSNILSDNLILEIYRTIINLVVRYDLTIYIIYECVNIILSMCKLCNQELIVHDFLFVYKFYIKNDKKCSERFIMFVILLIGKCQNKYQKSLFLKLIKSFNSFLYLLNTKNSDLCMFTKEALLTLKFLKFEFNNEEALSEEKSAHIIKVNKKLNLENEFIRIMNLVLFHLNFIYDISKKKKLDRKIIELQYDNFFKNLGEDILLKSYINEEIKIKKEKLFFSCENRLNKNTLIINNISEIENIVKTFDCFFTFIHNIKWYICFIFFFINTLNSIEKINEKLSFRLSKEFFFLIKNLFIQATYVFEIIEKKEGIANDEDINVIIDSIYIENEKNYNKSKILLLFEEKKIQKMIENIKIKSKLRNVNSIFVLLEDLYFVIINFLMPIKKKWVFFDSSNFYFFKKLLLRISYFYYKNVKCEQFIQIFFFESFFSRIKKKIKYELYRRKIDRHIFRNTLLIQNQNIKWIDIKSRYISLKVAAYFTFCLDFLKTVTLFDEKNNDILKNSKNKKRIINICKVQLLKYKFFLSSKTSNNCFSLSVVILYHLYLNIYKNKRNKKLLNDIILLLFLCTKKSLYNIKKENVIFYNNDLVKSKKCHKKKRSINTSLREINNVWDKENKGHIIITKKFEKPFEEYYLNSSLHIFITCLNTITNIIKLNIINNQIHYKNIIIKKSKIKEQKKKKKKYKKNKSNITLINYKYIRNLCNYILKKTHNDFFYSIRKYILSFIQHFISLNTILILKYKFKNSLDIKKIIDFCLYNILTDYDLNVFSIIYSIAFSLKKYISLCATKIKKSNYYFTLCDDLIFQILDHYYTYDYTSTNLWEEYISKLVSFDSLKHTMVDCPGE
ncbi:conserved Plasmodium protein, unknown function [Plasmodium gallinaceum]|uniref:Uncharacterized protein n=1 Tax=Plasmodium gallinaceum TaxID=5849 RepID=A0A1J1GPC6_PLAGA|nr:conserved Plasmodium protein, unknown function [Plasmodium gallinaceum]CRG94156.1 conserved Plasmodium protein, unknown function [Plasmodium gallinaceum]